MSRQNDDEPARPRIIQVHDLLQHVQWVWGFLQRFLYGFSKGGKYSYMIDFTYNSSMHLCSIFASLVSLSLLYVLIVPSLFSAWLPSITAEIKSSTDWCSSSRLVGILVSRDALESESISVDATMVDFRLDRVVRRGEESSCLTLNGVDLFKGQTSKVEAAKAQKALHGWPGAMASSTWT